MIVHEGHRSVGAGREDAAVIVKLAPLEVPPPGAGLKTVTVAVPAVAMSAAVMAAVTCVAETNVVVRLVPFQRTAEPEMKFVPLTVRVKAEPPAMAEVGLKEPMVGTGLLAVIVKLAPLEVPPPGAGLKTVTVAVPAVAMSAAVMAAVTCVAETNVVVRLVPFQRTAEPEMKFVPLTVRVKAEPPAMAEVGLKEPMVGTGLLAVDREASPRWRCPRPVRG